MPNLRRSTETVTPLAHQSTHRAPKEWGPTPSRTSTSSTTAHSRAGALATIADKAQTLSPMR
jgi:hypothetical protein